MRLHLARAPAQDHRMTHDSQAQLVQACARGASHADATAYGRLRKHGRRARGGKEKPQTRHPNAAGTGRAPCTAHTLSLTTVATGKYSKASENSS
eukprot:scaffold70485_cov32-Tisochrysis_lutea.AAC.2